MPDTDGAGSPTGAKHFGSGVFTKTLFRGLACSEGQLVPTSCRYGECLWKVCVEDCMAVWGEDRRKQSDKLSSEHSYPLRYRSWEGIYLNLFWSVFNHHSNHHRISQ